MNLFFSLLNALSVSLFGSVLSASFCDALSTPKKRRLFWLCALTLPLLQGIMFLSRDYEFVRLIYPVTVHLPLWLVLCALTGKYLSPAVSVLSAYLCCQLRRWMVLLIVTLFSGGQLNVASFFEEKLWLLLKSERNTGKRKLAFFCPYFSRTGGEAKASPPKMTQNSAVPPRKVFAELFSKSDPPRPQAPPRRSTPAPVTSTLQENTRWCRRGGRARR